jgi:hypothetical protein
MDANELMRKITHLETEITEHRMRSDAFKTNFERIKSEHARVQQANSTGRVAQFDKACSESLFEIGKRSFATRVDGTS